VLDIFSLCVSVEESAIPPITI